MTGFGRAERIAQGITVTVQVSSVNRKNLEVMCSLPKEFQSLERKVIEQAKQAVGRGRLQFSIDVRDMNGGSVGLPNDSQIEAGIARVRELAQRHGGSAEIDATTIVDLMASLLALGQRACFLSMRFPMLSVLLSSCAGPRAARIVEKYMEPKRERSATLQVC